MLRNLNKYQKSAVLITEGPMRIIAGPGSGKTRTIIAKANYILEKELANPNQILLLTFTNKAANEVKHRLEEKHQTIKHVFTFHGFAAYFLRLEAKRINIDKDYIILDRNDQTQILKKELKNLSEKNTFFGSLELKEVYEKFTIFNTEDTLNNEHEVINKYDQLILELYKKYKLYKEKIHGYDFDDLLNNLDKILKENKEVRESWQKRFKYIFVDEFQDVNNVQYSIIKNLTNENSNITVVGDPDQNIYSWRGSNISFILNFEKDFPSAKTIILKLNYRSTLNIIDISNKLISHNKDRINFEVVNVKDKGEQINVLKFHSRSEQAENIVSQIIYLNREKGIKLKEIAIIYRANYLSREFENSLARRGVNYRLIGGLKFYDREEIKRLLFLLRFVIFQDDYSFINIINFPSRGFGEKSLEKLENFVDLSSGTGFWGAISSKPKELKLKPKIINFIDQLSYFINLFNNLKTGANFSNLFRKFVDEVGILDFYKDNLNKTENIEGFFEQLRDNFVLSTDLRADIIEFLNQTTLLSGSDNESLDNHVSLITAHASKGTEYKVVFLVSFNQNIFPSYQSIEEGNLEEERRVAYVAITRAKSILYISYITGFNYDIEPSSPSKFLFDMDLVEKVNLDRLNAYHNPYKNSDDEDENTKVPKGFSEDNSNVKVESIIFHRKYKEGVVVSIEDDMIKVAFGKKIGIKTLLKNHPSWYLKMK